MNALHFNITDKKLVSKLGGLPNMPKSLKWPASEDGEYLPFLCQIDLSEFKNDFANGGILYFFCSLSSDEIYDQTVIYYDGDEKLEPRTVDPDKLDGVLDCDYPLKAYFLEFDADGGNEEVTALQLFGKGNYLQGNIEEEEFDEQDKLLLQVDAQKFDNTFQYICSTMGRIYFVILKEDLNDKNFKDVYAEMQYT